MTHIRFPFGFDAQGRTATVDDERHLRDLIEQVLFTQPGERVNRPDFGAGLAQLLFAPNSDELATATAVLVQGALQRELGDRIAVEGVQVDSHEATLTVTVVYSVRRSSERRIATFERTG